MSPTRNSPALQYRRRKHIGELLYIAHVLRSAWEHTLRTKQEKSSLFSVSIPGFSISRFAPRVSGGAGRRDSTWKQTWAMFSLVRGPVGADNAVLLLLLLLLLLRAQTSSSVLLSSCVISWQTDPSYERDITFWPKYSPLNGTLRPRPGYEAQTNAPGSPTPESRRGGSSGSS